MSTCVEVVFGFANSSSKCDRIKERFLSNHTPPISMKKKTYAYSSDERVCIAIISGQVHI